MLGIIIVVVLDLKPKYKIINQIKIVKINQIKIFKINHQKLMFKYMETKFTSTFNPIIPKFQMNNKLKLLEC